MSDADRPAPLPPGTRALLLAVLATVYPPGSAQTRLGGSPDGAIAWQVQSALDDFAEYTALPLIAANDDAAFPANDNIEMDEAA